MTNHYNDIKNSDCILIMGSNAAEITRFPSNGSCGPVSRGGRR